MSGPAPLAQKQHAAPRPATAERATPEAGAESAPRYVQAMVQAKCDACAAEDSTPEAPVQLWSCGGDGAPTCTDVVQTWSCGGDGAPTCTDEVQTKCESCEGDEEARAPVQHEAAGAPVSRTSAPNMVHGAARQGLAGANQTLPHGDRIQSAFGRHDISRVRTSIGGPADGATRRVGALAFTSGDRIGFRDSPDLRLAAHEAAHVVQQRAGLKLPGGVGRVGDRWERHADSVADAVVGGRSAEPLLDEVSQPGSTAVTAPVQRKITGVSERRHEPPPLPVSVPSSGGAATEPAAEGGAGEGEAAESEVPAMEAAEAGQPAEAPPEGVEVGGAAPAAASAPAGGGAINAPCFHQPAPPRTSDTKPTSDQASSKQQEEAAVTFDPWPDEADVCQADNAAAQSGQQVAAQTRVEAARTSVDGGGEGGGAALGAEAAPDGEPAAEGGEAASASGEVRQMSSAASNAEDQRAPQAGSGDGDIADAEAQRGAAWTEYDSSLEVLGGVSARVPRLTQGISFGEGGEPAATQARGFMSRIGGQIERAVGFAQSDAPSRLGGLADATNASIAATIEIEKQAISNRIGLARDLAYAGAAGARAHVEAEYIASAATVESETLGAIEALDGAHLTAVDQIAEKETTGLEGVDASFATGRTEHEGKGPEYSRRAVARGQEHVARYDRCRAGPGNDHVRNREDGFWDGCLTVRRARAQQDAACKTAAGYHKGFLRTANKKGYDLRPLRSQYRCAVISGARQVTETLDSSHEQLVSGLDTARLQAMAGLATARTQNLTAIDAALGATLRSLSTQEFTQRQAVDDSGYLKQLAIEQLAHASAAALGRGIGAAMDSLDETLDGLRERFSGGGTPDPTALAAALETIEGSLGGGMELLLGKMEEGAAGGEARIAQFGALALEALLGITTANDETTSQAESGFSSQMNGLMSGASSAFSQLTTSHVTQCQQTSTQGVATMEEAVTGFETALTTIYTQVDEAITQSLTELETQLGGDLARLDGDIATAAREAAEKEQPAWKSVVAILLVILVIIAAAVISIATLGAGASLFAVILVGAIVGAISAGLIQIINNWASGQAWHEGLAQAMIMGAIGGAIGGGIGFGAGALAASAGAAGARIATQLAITVGGDLLAEAATQTVGYFAYGQEFNWQGFVMAGAMSGVSFRATPRAGSAAAHAAAPTAGRRAAVTQIAGGAAVGIGLEGLTSLVTGERFDYSRAASQAAGGALAARMSRLGGHGGASETPREPTRIGRAMESLGQTRTGRALGRGLDRVRSFDPGGLGARYQGAMEHLGTRIGGGPPELPATRSHVAAPDETAAPRQPADETAPAPRRADAESETPTPRRSDAETEAHPSVRPESEAGPLRDGPDTPARERTDAELASARTHVDVDGQPHTVTPRRIGDQVSLFACSGHCGPLTQKLQAFLDDPNLPADRRAAVQRLHDEITSLERAIAAGQVSSREVIDGTNRISRGLTDAAEGVPSLRAALETTAITPEITNRIAGEWGVNPSTRRHDPSATIEGLTPQQIHAQALRNARSGADPNVRLPNEPDIVFRWRRHRADGERFTTPSEFGSWCESGFNAHHNQARSRPIEGFARGMLGAADNNVAGGGVVANRPFNDVPHTEKVHPRTGHAIPDDVRGPRGTRRVAADTRPDGLRPNASGGYDVVEHKHIRAGETADGVMNDRQQLRAQRTVARANSGVHELILSTDAPLRRNANGQLEPAIRPSDPLGRNPDTTIYFYDSHTRLVTHRWRNGQWRPI